jgi:hypothetical protein
MSRTLTILGAIVLLAAGAIIWQRANPLVLRAETEIHASADEVWEVLADRAAYPDWNPFIVRSEGELTVGKTISNVMRSGGTDREFTPTLLAVEPGRELRWIGRLYVPGLFDGEHSFVIEQLAPGRVRLVQEETFKGALVPFLAGMLKNETLPAFRAMNAALADRVAAIR